MLPVFLRFVGGHPPTRSAPSATPWTRISFPHGPSSWALIPTRILRGLAHREIAYDIRCVCETVQTGAGEATYQEEKGLVDIVDGIYSYRTIPALIAQTLEHLPSSIHLLLGVQQINDQDNKCDVHRKHRRLPLQSYDPESDLTSTRRYNVG